MLSFEGRLGKARKRLNELIKRRTPYLLLLCGLWAGCGPRESASISSSDAAARTEAAELTPVRLMLNWYPEAEHGGYYAALVHGYFAEEGLEVTIVPGGPNAPVIQQVARGQVQFGVTNADGLVVARAEGARLKALLAPLQNSPRCLLVHEASGITSFEQLRNVTIMMAQEQAWGQFLLKTLPLEGVTVVPNTASLAPFLANQRSAKQGYVISEPFVAQSQGAKVRSLLVADLGFNPYTSLLVASDELVERQPELVAKMAAASRKGWLKYLEAPAQTNQQIHQLNPEMGLDILEFGVRAIKEHCVGPAATPENFGGMSPERWATLVSQLEDLKLVEPGKVASEALVVQRTVGSE